MIQRLCPRDFDAKSDVYCSVYENAFFKDYKSLTFYNRSEKASTGLEFTMFQCSKHTSDDQKVYELTFFEGLSNPIREIISDFSSQGTVVWKIDQKNKNVINTSFTAKKNNLVHLAKFLSGIAKSLFIDEKSKGLLRNYIDELYTDISNHASEAKL